MVKEKIEEIKKRGNRKERVGTVISDRQEKTIIVEVERRTAHPLYKKVVKTSKRYVADDQSNEAAVGDKVKIIESLVLATNLYSQAGDVSNTRNQYIKKSKEARSIIMNEVIPAIERRMDND